MTATAHSLIARVIRIDCHSQPQMSGWEVLTDYTVGNLVTKHPPEAVLLRRLFDREPVEPRLLEVGVLGSGRIVEELTAKVVGAETLAPTVELLEAKLFGEDRSVSGVVRTATAEGAVCHDIEPRFVLADIGVSVGVGPSIAYKELVVLVRRRIGILERAYK